MFRNILVAVDGSPAADLALESAIGLAEPPDTRLTLFTAVAEPHRPRCWGVAAAGMIGFYERAEAEAQRITTRARRRVPRRIRVAVVVSRRPVREALVRQLADGDHDLLVIGEPGGAPGRLKVHRSLSDYVLDHSGVSVLIVHAGPYRDHTAGPPVVERLVPDRQRARAPNGGSEEDEKARRRESVA
jgi:nucleotide-binding universal stress UspA family protein